MAGSQDSFSCRDLAARNMGRLLSGEGWLERNNSYNVMEGAKFPAIKWTPPEALALTSKIEWIEARLGIGLNPGTGMSQRITLHEARYGTGMVWHTINH